MPLWNYIINQSLLVQVELSTSSKDEKVLEMSNLKVNAEINGENTANDRKIMTNSHHLIDISLIDSDTLAFSDHSRRQGEGLAPRNYSDFVVAIGFIVFGVVAICAGVYSEVMAQTTEVKEQTTAFRRALF